MKRANKAPGEARRPCRRRWTRAMCAARWLGAGRDSQRGFAILMVVLVLVGLVIIGAPFAISMRQEEQASLNFAARIRAKLAAQSSLHWAMAQLERSHEYLEQYEAEQPLGGEYAIFNSPQADEKGEFRVDLFHDSLAAVQTADPTGAMWGVRVTDEQGKANLKTASRALLRNLLAQILGEARGHAIADAIVQYRDTQGHQFTTLSQLREVGGGLTAAEYDQVAPFLTVHSASLVGEVAAGSVALHPVNVNACTEEMLRAVLRGVKLAPQEGEATEHQGVGLDSFTGEVDGESGTWTDDFEALIARLRVAHRLATTTAERAASVSLDSVENLPPSGWVAIEGDAVKYEATSGSSLVVSDEADDPPAALVNEPHPHRGDVPASEVEARLLLTDVATDLARILDQLVDEKKLTPRSRSAILANAINPRDPVLVQDTSTAPLCFRSFNIYTIEATGVVNHRDGRELARHTIRQVAQIAPAGNLEIRIETQADFEASRQGGIAHHVATWPEATQVSDIPPVNTEARATALFRRGRLGLEPAEVIPAGGTTFVARFNGPLASNTLHGDAGTRMPVPVALEGFQTVRCEAGEEGDVEPEGVHVGLREFTDKADEKRILAYPARHDEDLGQSNVPHGGEYVRPFILEMWVKFDDDFDYSRDHFLFDLAQATFTNRVALYYDSTASDAGDLVLHVCDATLQQLPAQVRCPITEGTFEPQRWYHLAAVVKGIGYNQMALLVDGRSVGHYEPSAALTADLDVAATAAACDDLAWYQDAKVFAPFHWPSDDCVVIGGELIEHGAATSTQLAALLRGARDTQARRHFAGTRVEIYGYDDLLRKGSYHWNDTEYLMDHLLRAGEEPSIDRPIPATMQEAVVDDGDEQAPEGVTFEEAPDTTADKTTQYWSPAATKYQAATLDGNTIPADGWLPVSYSDMWIVPAGQDPTDDETRFAQAAGLQDGGKPEDRVLAGLLAWKDPDETLSTTQRTIEDATHGLGFIRVLDNEDESGENHTGEIIKFSQAGVVLVWRWHPDDQDDPETEEDERRKIAWYIGYLAGLGQNPPPEPAPTHQRRGCFGTEPRDIMEGARIRLDCLRLTHNQNLARGHREEVVTEIEQPDGTFVKIGQRNGLGIFQLYRDPATYEWVQFTWPQFQPEEDETALLGGEAGPWLVGISRAARGTAPGGSATQGRAFQVGDRVMPVFFTHNRVRVMNQYLPIVKGPGDQVTLTDLTGQREPHVVAHGAGHLFSFREPVTGVFLYTNDPRVLKFPSGNLPTRPDRLFYLGSDAVCHEGDVAQPFTEGGGDTSRLDEPPEPERPADATFDEVKIYPAGTYPAAGLYDWHSETPGSPKDQRWVAFAPDSDAAPLEADLAPPFTIRVGHLERLSPQPSANPDGSVPFQQPFRFIANGHARWPQEGYVKIDDECFFTRTLYRNRHGSHSAGVVLPSGAPYDENGLAIALTADGNAVYVDEGGADFPEQGYITIHNSWPDPTYWSRVQTLGGGDPALVQSILQWLGAEPGRMLLNESGGHLTSGSSISAPERLFYDGKEKVTVDGQECWKLTLAHRGILDSSPREIKFVDPDSTPSWFVEGHTDPGGATVEVLSVELLVLRRACLGTEAERHAIGTIALPLEHIPTSLTPRPMVKLRRDLETGQLQRDPDDSSLVRALDDNDADFDITEPEYEYGIVLEDRDYFPEEGVVQIGDELLAYVQDGAESGAPVWNARVPVWDQAQGAWVRKTLPCLTGIKHFRQRYGTARASYVEYTPGHANALNHVDPGVPDPNKDPGDPGYAIQPAPPYWVDHGRHIVHVREFRYPDRFPQREPATPEANPDTYVGRYAPHWNDTQLGYYEFAITLPGARWTRVQWTELLYRPGEGLTNDPLGSSGNEDDPFDVQVLVQLDGAPGWDDMTRDPAATLNGVDIAPDPFVSTPVHWREFPDRDDAYDSDPGSYRPRKPVVFRFDEGFDPDEAAVSRPPNYINPYREGGSLRLRGQTADRIRLRVLFQYRNEGHAAPGYRVPWRTPWVDTILLNYKAPTHVMEHTEVSY